jgi:hypothetical protein
VACAYVRFEAGGTGGLRWAGVERKDYGKVFQIYLLPGGGFNLLAREVK